jgi:hypothetical protein
METSELNVTREALTVYRRQWEWWLQAMHTTDAERELARMKIALIDAELARAS